jgi:hypothetical protein
VAGLGALERELAQLDELAGAMRIFNSIAEGHGGELPPRYRELEASFGECAAQVLQRASRIPQTVMEGGTVGAYLRVCCRNLPAAGATAESATFARAAWGMPAAIHRLYLLALGELVSLCDAAEKARGIRPIRLVA